MKKPLILVTNDDGIHAPGIRFLVRIMNQIGDVVVVAPDSAQSGMGHAITINSILQYKELELEGKQKDYSCSGTPADCVKIATKQILTQKPDLVVSGINHGSNAAINVVYSGTMSAAIEAGIDGLPAIGFSLCDYSEDADFTPCEEYIKKITRQTLENPMPKGIVLNVNFPKAKKEEIKGIRVCRQAQSKWVEDFQPRETPYGKKYFWLTGHLENQDQGEDTDLAALEQNYVSVVAVKFDLTAYEYMQELGSHLTN